MVSVLVALSDQTSYSVFNVAASGLLDHQLLCDSLGPSGCSLYLSYDQVSYDHMHQVTV